MSETDPAIKILVNACIGDLAAWLMKRETASFRELNVELPAEVMRTDLLYFLEFEDGKNCLFHLEFQGRSSKPEMPWRQLGYLSRAALQNHESVPGRPQAEYLESFVLYIGKNAGAQDNGHHYFPRLQDEHPALEWRYTPIHLWQLEAEDILKLDKVGLIPLMGLMHITQPEKTIPRMVQRIRNERDVGLQQVLFTALLSLMTDKECVKMAQKLLESDNFVLDTPFIREIREQGWKDGIQKGIQEGIQEGIQKGRQEGRQEGIQKGIQEGRIDGIHQGLVEAVAFGLKLRFGVAGTPLLAEIAAIQDINLLRAILATIEVAQSPQEVRRVYKPE